MNRTKVICTLGPAVDSVESLSDLLREGMNGARFNFSHGSHESHAHTLEMLREACRSTGKDVATILDTKGPEIRICSFILGSCKLAEGDIFTLRTDMIRGTDREVSVTYDRLAEEVSVGNTVLLDDGLIRMTVEEVSGTKIICRVQDGGVLKNNKSICLPECDIQLPTLTGKDIEDLRFGVEQGFDYVAASFVRSGEDVRAIRQTLDRFGGEKIRIISKIENRQGVNNLEEIIRESDGIMVARGDLGVEIPAEEVPPVQKRMIRRARAAGKIVIVATQMLDSMIQNPRPTRAEVSDVANAVYDRASCVMLSGETASGSYPLGSLKTMVRILQEAEKEVCRWEQPEMSGDAFHMETVSDAITHTGCIMARDLAAKAIVTATKSGFTAKLLARFCPPCPILAITPESAVYRQLMLCWGISPMLCEDVATTDELFALCAKKSREAGIADTGDTIVITAGIPMGRTGSTNLIKAEILK